MFVITEIAKLIIGCNGSQNDIIVTLVLRVAKTNIPSFSLTLCVLL